MRAERELSPTACLGLAFGAMGLAALLVWGCWTVWALSGDTLQQRLVQPVELVPDIGTWRTAVGSGQLEGHGFKLLEPGPLGNTIVAIELPDLLQVGRFARVEIHAVDRLPEFLTLGWSRSPVFQPGLGLPVQKLNETSGVVVVDGHSDWQGGIYFLSLEQVGFAGGPWVLQSLVLHQHVPDFFELQRLLLASLFPPDTWMQRSPNLIRPLDTALQTWLVPAVTLWIALSAGLMLAMGLGQVRRGPLWLLLPLMLGWLALDLRWQVELVQKARNTYVTFSGVPAENRFSQDLDGRFFDFLQALPLHHERLEFDRVFAFSEFEFLRKRARYHLASWAVREAPVTALTPAVSAQFRSGDLLLLLDVPQLRFEISDDVAHVSGLDGQLLVTGQLLYRQREWAALKVL